MCTAELWGNAQANSVHAAKQEGYTVFNERYGLFVKGDEFKLIQGTRVVCLKLYPFSTEIVLVSRFNGMVFYFNTKTGKLKEKKHSITDEGYHYMGIPTGERDEDGRQIFIIKTVSTIVLETYCGRRPTVEELKIIKGIGTEVDMYDTVVIAEFKNEHHTDYIDYCLDNLEWDFVKRGIRHHAWKIGNGPVYDARELMMNGEFPSNAAFKAKWGLDVSDSAITKMKYGDTWQVRTKPIAPMTNPMEELKDNIG